MERMFVNPVVHFAVTLFLLSGIFTHGPAKAETEFTIGTGGTSGVYYLVGRSICRIINNNSPGLQCNAPSTAGSISNLKEIRAGNIHLGVAQSDWQFHAFNGSYRFSSDGADKNLRALFSVHSEPFTLVVLRGSGINSIHDLPGRRVNIGNPGSGQRGTMEIVMDAMGWDKKTFSLANELTSSEQSLALCHKRIEAMVYTVGHPNASVRQATDLCLARVAEVKGGAIDKLVNDNPYYAYTQVPGGLYPGNDQPVNTFGVKATLVSSAKVDAELIYQVVKNVFEHFDEFRKKHPAFRDLDPKSMLKDGLSAPLHEGAMRYYKERGWM